MLYKQTKKTFEGFREISPDEFVKDEDRVVANTTRTWGSGTTYPPNYLQGGCRWWLFAYGQLSWVAKKPIMAKDLIDTCCDRYKKMLGDSIVSRKYSIWRKKIVIERRDWQTQPLPLP